MSCVLDDSVPGKDEVHLRNLSPIKEEEQCEDRCPVSPFGIRRKPPANPEDRPIRPGVGVWQKTFEEFVEEQLKADQDILQKEKQGKKEVKLAESKYFLRKGQGMIRIERRKDSVQKSSRGLSVILPPRTESITDQRRHLSEPTLLHTEEAKANRHPPCRSSFSQVRPKTNEVEKQLGADLKAGNESNVEFQGTLHKSIENTASIYDVGENKVSTKISNDMMFHRHLCVAERDCASHTQEQGGMNESVRTQSFESATVLTDLEQAFSGGHRCKKDNHVNAMETCVGFKKVNDHIVRVPEESSLVTNSGSENGDSWGRWEGPGLVMETTWCPHPSGPNSEADPLQQHHEQAAPQTAPMLGHKDQNLDLSEDDYASDAPSEPEARPASRPWTPHGLVLLQQFSSSSCSSSSDTEELQALHRSSTAAWAPHAKTFRKPTVGKKAPAEQPPTSHGGDVKSKPPSTSQLIASLFPAVKTKMTKTAHRGHCNRPFGSEDSQHGNEPLLRLQRDNALMMKAEMGRDSVMEKTKEEQHNPLGFLRQSICRSECEKRDYFSKCGYRPAKQEGQALRSQELTPNIGIQELRLQIVALQEQFKERESHWLLAHERLQGQVEALTRENVELRGEHTVTTTHHQEARGSNDKLPSHSRTKTMVSEAVGLGTCLVKRAESSSSRLSRSCTPVGRLWADDSQSAKPEVQ
ncbi:hypothetical protein JZ751_005082, partial [Albula glossodonta]